MEFEKNAPVSDEQRHLAEAKKVTLQPVHANVTPDALSDSEVAARTLNNQPIGNVNNDVEQNAPLIRPAKEILDPSVSLPQKQPYHISVKLVATAIVGLLVIAGGMIAAAILIQ